MSKRSEALNDGDRLHRLRVSLLAQVAQWRFQAEHLTPADVMAADALDERAQVLRECAHDLERFLEAEGQSRAKLGGAS